METEFDTTVYRVLKLFYDRVQHETHPTTVQLNVQNISIMSDYLSDSLVSEGFSILEKEGYLRINRATVPNMVYITEKGMQFAKTLE